MRVKMRSNKNDLTFGPPCLYMYKSVAISIKYSFSDLNNLDVRGRLLFIGC